MSTVTIIIFLGKNIVYYPTQRIFENLLSREYTHHSKIAHFALKKANGCIFLKGKCYCEAGTTKQEIIMCAGCLLKYGRLSNYIPRLVVSDRQNSSEDQIIKSCESAASTTKSSPDSLLF
jgi:hypothetical protein